MKILNITIVLVLGLSMPVYANSSDDEVSKQAMEMHEKSQDSVMKRVEIPDEASEKAVDDATFKYRKTRRDQVNDGKGSQNNSEEKTKKKLNKKHGDEVGDQDRDRDQVQDQEMIKDQDQDRDRDQDQDQTMDMDQDQIRDTEQEFEQQPAMEQNLEPEPPMQHEQNENLPSKE